MNKEDIVTLDDLLEENGYSIEQSAGGSWRLMRDDVLIYDDPACEDLNEDEDTAVAFFTGYFKEYVKLYSIDYETITLILQRIVSIIILISVQA